MDESLYLRRFNPDDYHLINKWRNTPGMYDMTTGPEVSITLEQDREWVKRKADPDNKTQAYFAICQKADNRMIGYESLNNIDSEGKTAEWGGIIIGEVECRRGGACLNAARLLFDYAFYELALESITGEWLAGHRASLMMGYMLGFKTMVVKEREIFKLGRHHDLIVMRLDKQDYEARQQALSSLNE